MTANEPLGGAVGSGTPQPDDPLARVEDALNRGNRFRRADVSALAAEARRYRIIHDEELSYRDLEMKIRDGSLDLRAVLGNEGGDPLFRLLAAICMNFLLGEDDEMPPNYRMGEFEYKPAGEVVPIRMSMEVLAPGGRTSHAIRRELEAEVERLAEALVAAPPPSYGDPQP